MPDRRVNVKITGDASNYQAALAKMAAATEAAEKRVEDSSKRVEIARRREQTATDQVRVASMRLQEARGKEGVSSSQVETRVLALARAQDLLKTRTNETAAATRKLQKAQEDFQRVRGLESAGVPGDFRKTLDAVEREAGHAGGRSGRTFAKQFGVEFRQRSVFIAGVVGAALTAGAPLALAGAAMLFGGIAAYAGAQSVEVRTAWTDLGHEIKNGLVNDSQAMIPALTGMADDLGKAFHDLGPQLTDAFEATAPLVQAFTDGITGLVSNAMPGLVDAVQNAGPVMDGFQTFLEDIGTGLSNMFKEMSDHSGAAGQAFADWGDVFAQLLPLIGDLLGKGAELANVVLPPLADAFGAIKVILDAIAPVLPIIAAGFVAFKIAGKVAIGITALGKALDSISVKTGMAAAGTSRMESGLSKVGKALPLVGFALIGLDGMIHAHQNGIDNLADGYGTLFQQVHNGGEEGIKAREKLDTLRAKIAELGDANSIASQAFAKAEAASRAYWGTLTPLEQAQSKVTEWSGRLSTALRDQGAGSDAANAAGRRLAFWTQQEALEQGRLETAVDGVTTAMIEQADQAMATIDSGFAYRHAVEQLTDAQNTLKDVTSHLNDTNKDTRTTQDDVARASLAVEEQSYRTALAYGQQQADLSGLGKESAGYARIVQEQTLAALIRLRDAAGPEMRVAIDQQIRALRDSGVQMDDTSAHAGHLRDTVKSIPPYTKIQVEADIGPAQTTLSNFIARHWTAIISSQVAGSGTSGSGGTVRRIASGGFISGAGTPTSDSIPAMLSDGEFVVNAAATSRHRSTLEAINSGGVRHFASGGPVMKDKIIIHYNADMSGANAGMLAAQRAAGAAVATAAAAAAPSSAGGNVGLVQSMAAARGWTGAQWNALYTLIMHESGFRNTAQNPTSTAYGMFQFLNSTWASTGYAKTSDPRAQALAGFQYIASRYGSPIGAWNFWSGHHWYADGGVVNEPVFGVGLRSGQTYSFAENGPEIVMPASREYASASHGGGGGTTSVTLDGAHITGRLALDNDGFARLIDGRIEIDKKMAQISARRRGRPR